MSEYFCSNCGLKLEDGQTFCPKCGTPRAEEKQNVCSNCGAELTEGQKFCGKCGQKSVIITAETNQAAPMQNNRMNAGVPRKKKNKTLIIVLAIVLAVVLVGGCIGGFFIYSNIQKSNREKAVAAYVSDARSFAYDVIKSCSDLETVGNKMQLYWYGYIWNDGVFYDDSTLIYVTDADDAIGQARTNASDELNAAVADKETIDDLYDSLSALPDGTDSELSDVQDAVSELYDSYTTFYDCIISPSGNYDSWTSDASDSDTNAVDDYDTLDNLLQTFETQSGSASK